MQNTSHLCVLATIAEFMDMADISSEPWNFCYCFKWSWASDTTQTHLLGCSGGFMEAPMRSGASLETPVAISRGVLKGTVRLFDVFLLKTHLRGSL